MFCSNCGANLEEGKNFCGNCGAVVSGYTEEVETTDSIPENTEVTQQAPICEESGYEIVKKPKKKLVLSVVGAILILGVLGFFFKNSVLAAFAPKFYVENALLNTINQIAEQVKQSQTDFYGFDVENQKDVTYTVAGTLDKFDDMKFDGIGAEISAIKSDKKKKAEVNGAVLIDGDKEVSFITTLDDESIIVDIPELFDESLKMSSKTFGKDWNDSKIGKESDVELSDKLDLSYSELMNKREVFTEETTDALKNLTKEFVKASTVEKEKGSCEVDGKTVNTRRIDVTVTSDSLEDYLVDTIKIIADDDNITENLSSDMEDGFEDGIDEMCDSVKEVFKNFDDDFVFSMDVYKGKVMRIFYEGEVEEADISFEIGFKDSKTPINNVYMLLEIKADGEKMSVELESVGNHIGKGNVFTDETTIEIEVPYEDKVTIDASYSFDMKKKVCEAEVSAKIGDEKFEVSLDGTCSNKKEFKLQIEDIKIKSSEEDISIKGKFEITIAPEAKFTDIDKDKALDLFDCSEDDMTDWADDVEKNAEKLGEKLYEKYADELDFLTGDSYPNSNYLDDDYYYEDEYDDYYYDDEYDDYYYDEDYDDYYYDY